MANGENPKQTKIKVRRVSNLTQITMNLTPNRKVIRHDTLEGRKHLVVPMVMLAEGVHSGDQGPFFYPAKELKRSVSSWNHRPIVAYHPTINGKGVSACDPLILNSRKTGIVLNTRYDDKLRGEAWLEEDRMDKVDEKIRQFIDNGQVMEISTGLHIETDLKAGEWNGEKFRGTAYNHKPDHLALLPEGVGAYPISKGGGLLQLNHSTNEEILTKLHPILCKVLDSGDFWIENVYPEAVIYATNGKFYQLHYALDEKGVLMVQGDPEEVGIGFSTKSGQLIGNTESSFFFQQREKLRMAKKELVDRVITDPNTQFEEADRATLMNLSDDVVDRIVPKAANKPEPEPVSPPNPQPSQYPTPTQPTPGGNPNPNESTQPHPVANEATVTPTPPAPRKPMTMQEWGEFAPREFMEVYNYGLSTLQTQRDELVEMITTNEQNQFSKEELAVKNLNELQKLAMLARQPARIESIAPQLAAFPKANFAGAATLPVGNARQQKMPPVLPANVTRKSG